MTALIVALALCAPAPFPRHEAKPPQRLELSGTYAMEWAGVSWVVVFGDNGAYAATSGESTLKGHWHVDHEGTLHVMESLRPAPDSWLVYKIAMCPRTMMGGFGSVVIKLRRISK